MKKSILRGPCNFLISCFIFNLLISIFIYQPTLAGINDLQVGKKFVVTQEEDELVVEYVYKGQVGSEQDVFFQFGDIIVTYKGEKLPVIDGGSFSDLICQFNPFNNNDLDLYSSHYESRSNHFPIIQYSDRYDFTHSGPCKKRNMLLMYAHDGNITTIKKHMECDYHSIEAVVCANLKKMRTIKKYEKIIIKNGIVEIIRPRLEYPRKYRYLVPLRGVSYLRNEHPVIGEYAEEYGGLNLDSVCQYFGFGEGIDYNTTFGDEPIEINKEGHMSRLPISTIEPGFRSLSSFRCKIQ